MLQPFYVSILPSFYIITFFTLSAHLHELTFSPHFGSISTDIERGINRRQKIASSPGSALNPSVLEEVVRSEESAQKKGDLPVCVLWPGQSFSSPPSGDPVS